MKKYIIGAGMIAGMLLLSGCTQPSFNPNNKSVTFKDGKPYAIPHNTKFLRMDKEMINMLRASGVNQCRVGDYLWKSDKAEKQIESNMNNVGPVLYKSFRNGDMGCAKPLNKQEYQYWMNRSNQQSANARVESQNLNNTLNNINRNTAIQNAALMPKTYNVYHH